MLYYKTVSEELLELLNSLMTITQRDSKKDFIDLYFLLNDYSLRDIFSFYEQKISDGNAWLALRSLTYFGDAEEQPMPKMFQNVNWQDVQLKIRKAVIELQNTFN